MNQYSAMNSKIILMMIGFGFLLGESPTSTIQSPCYADDAPLTENQRIQIRLSDLEWALGVNARDDLLDPLRATHHFLRAAQAAQRAGHKSRVTSCLIAASYTAGARDRYLIHPVKAAVFSSDSTRLLTFNNGPEAWLWDPEQSEPLQTFQHQKEILAAKFNNKGTRVLTYSLDGTACLWKIGQKKPLVTIQHNGEVSGAVWTADESKILTWSKDKTARLWEVNQPNQPLRTFRHDGPVTDAVFNADESKLLTSGDDNTARLWNAKTGELIHKLVYKPHDYLDAWMKTTITEPAFRDNESHISFRCYDGISLWDAKRGTLIDTISGKRFTERNPRFLAERKGVVSFYDDAKGQATKTFHHGLDILRDVQLKVVGFNQNRTRFLTSLNLPYYGHTHQGWVQLWNINEKKPLRTFRHDGLIKGALFFNHSDQVLTYSQDGTARIWSTKQSQTPRTIRHQGSITGAVLSPDEKLLLTWTNKGTVRLTELGREDNGQLLGQFKPDYPGDFAWTQLPPNGLRAVTWDPYEKTIRHVDILKNTTIRTFTLDRDVEGVSVSPDKSLLFARSKGGREILGTGWLWKLNQKQPVAKFDSAGVPTFNRDGSQVFIPTKEGGVLYDIKQEKTIKKFHRAEERERIAKVAFTSNGVRVFTQGLQYVRLWDIDGKTPLGTFERDKRIKHVIFSENGGRFLTWGERYSSGQDVHLWDVKHDQPNHTFRGDEDFGQATFSPNGNHILSWSSSPGGSARLWDASTGKLLTTFRRHGHIVKGLFTPDGNRALTITWDGKAYLWDLDLEEPLRTFRQTSWFRSPVFTKNGRSLIAQGDNKVVRWSIAVDRKRAIERQQRDYEIKTGTRLDQSGHFVPLSLNEWRQFRVK